MIIPKPGDRVAVRLRNRHLKEGEVLGATVIGSKAAAIIDYVDDQGRRYWCRPEQIVRVIAVDAATKDGAFRLEGRLTEILLDYPTEEAWLAVHRIHEDAGWWAQRRDDDAESTREAAEAQSIADSQAKADAEQRVADAYGMADSEDEGGGSL